MSKIREGLSLYCLINLLVTELDLRESSDSRLRLDTPRGKEEEVRGQEGRWDHRRAFHQAKHVVPGNCTCPPRGRGAIGIREVPTGRGRACCTSLHTATGGVGSSLTLIIILPTHPTLTSTFIASAEQSYLYSHFLVLSRRIRTLPLPTTIILYTLSHTTHPLSYQDPRSRHLFFSDRNSYTYPR